MKAKKEITIYDIATNLKLSPATVSRALQDSDAISKATKKKVQDMATKLGYRQNTFASNLRSRKTNTIGVIMHELNSSFMTSVLSGIEKVATDAGYDLIIGHSSESYEKEIANAQNFFYKRVDGLIASLAFETKSLDHYTPFSEKNIPVVFYDRVDDMADFTKVTIDNFKSGYLATKHLIEQGCKRIALVTASLKRNVYEQRYKGYLKALHEAKIPFRKELLIVKDLTEERGKEAAVEVLKMKPRPDGAFVTNDFSAAVFMQALKANNIRIPQDIAIVGFNNDVIGTLVEPQLTTIDYPGEEIGEVAARTLIAHLKGDSDISQMQTLIIKSALIVRGSSLKKIKK